MSKQRRPIHNHKVSERPLTCLLRLDHEDVVRKIAECSKKPIGSGDLYFISNTHGVVVLLDRATGIVHGTYLGAKGSIRGLAASSAPRTGADAGDAGAGAGTGDKYLVGVGLDRVLFVWDILTRRSPGRVFVKVHASCVLMGKDEIKISTSKSKLDDG